MCKKLNGDNECANDINDTIDKYLEYTIDRVIFEKGECKLSVLLKPTNDWDYEILKRTKCNSLNLKQVILEAIHCIKCEDGEPCDNVYQLLNTKLSVIANALSDKESLTEVLMTLACLR